MYERSRRGLFGKHDNVRSYWEDELTRNALRPFLRGRMAACAAARRGLRVLDLGCGAGQGYELLTQIRDQDSSLEELPRHVVDSTDLEVYLGIDLSPAMVAQGRVNYRGASHVRFAEADLREDLGPATAERPFDVYFSSYGSLSHLSARHLEDRLVQVVQHAEPGAVVLLDLLGRFSLEWPAYWHASSEPEKTRPYSMSYLFGEDERATGKVETFPLRFWSGREVRELCLRVSERARKPLQVAEMFDRSIFVGRHIDTGEYGSRLPPLRRLVNALYEQNVHTPLAQLEIGYQPSGDVGFLNESFSRFSRCWDTVVIFARQRLAGMRIDLVELDGWRDFPGALQMALLTLDRVIDSVAWIDVGDVRANIIEPQLAYVLLRMIHRLQGGEGCGHGLVAMLTVDGPATANGCVGPRPRSVPPS
jgi:SAM-dependent methyltransferase